MGLFCQSQEPPQGTDFTCESGTNCPAKNGRSMPMFPGRSDRNAVRRDCGSQIHEAQQLRT
jgi:hypothetical protein